MLRNTLVSHEGHWNLSSGRSSVSTYHEILLDCACAGKEVCLIDCGCRFDPYALTRFLRHRRLDTTCVLDRIFISRVFTVHQLNTALRRENVTHGVMLISDLDRVISDDSIPDIEMRNVVRDCIFHLEGLRTPVFITAGDMLFKNRVRISGRS